MVFVAVEERNLILCTYFHQNLSLESSLGWISKDTQYNIQLFIEIPYQFRRHLQGLLLSRQMKPALLLGEQTVG